MPLSFVRATNSLVLTKFEKITKSVASSQAFSFFRQHSKAVIALFVLSEALALAGIIGKKGETVEQFLISSYPTIWHRIQDELDFRPGGKLRKRLDESITAYQSTPTKKRFAVSIGFAVTAFPIMTKITFSFLKVFMPCLLVAEVLALLGVLGDRGEGLTEWVEDDIPSFQRAQKWVNQKRLYARKVFRLDEMAVKIVTAAKNDHISMLGLLVGSVASMVLKG